MVAVLIVLALLAMPPASAGEDAYAEALGLYRGGDPQAALVLLERAIAGGGAGAGHHALAGWCRARLGDGDGARRSFERARELDPTSAEAWTGLGWLDLRAGWLAAARDALARAVELAPGDREARRLLDEAQRGVATERRPRGPVDRARPLDVAARAVPAGFEVREAGSWRRLFVVGVNLSTALPGRFPGEFPDDPALYRGWLDMLGELGANVVRLYTIHPPSLYRALAEHNAARPEHRLRLVQGVWVEPPPRGDFADAEFLAEVSADICRAVDAVHGNLELPPRPGRAHGVWDVDVSPDVLAYLVGREWEPFLVDAYDRRHAGHPGHHGRYVRTRDTARPFESWLAGLLDVAAAHETRHYRAQRPLAFSSWPTLDPLAHETESTYAEESALRGRPVEASDAEPAFDDDLATVDPTALAPGPDLAAGLFAAYHVYPYHPDFLLLEPALAEAHDAQGPNRYLGYLQKLRRRHRGLPVLVAEFGVPSSRGVSHLHPEGLHHGGHTEAEQGRIVLRLLDSIERAGLAGGVVFSWIDEWFKKNWLTVDFEYPAERDPLWLNVLDPEERFGLLAARPGSAGPRVVLDGRGEDWTGVEPTLRGEGILRSLRAVSDEAYVYLGLELGAALREGEREVWIGIDTHDAERGDHRFPEPAGVSSAIGLEFLLQLAGTESSRLLVDRPYDLFGPEVRRPYRSRSNDDGEFVAIAPETNRARIARDGRSFPALRHDRSVLRFGSTDPAAKDHDDLADWYAVPEGGLVEVRIPWALLQVADPSSRRVIHEETATAGPVETTVTDGFRFHVLALERGDGPESAWRVVDRSPAAGDSPLWSWPTWETPTFRLEPKESYRLIRRDLGQRPLVPERPR